MFYVALLTIIATTYGNPVPNLAPGQLLYYSQPQPQHQYVKANLQPYLQYSSVGPQFRKTLHSVQTPNDLFYYPAPLAAQQVLRNRQEITPASTTRFTAPPEGLVDAIYTWFAENNIPVPDDPSNNETRDQEKMDNPEKQAGEAEVLAEADKTPNFNYPKKTSNPSLQPGQRFYILNGQPQFIGVPTMFAQPMVPQVVMRSAFPEDQNLLFYQPQSEVQQSNLKFRNSGIGVQNQAAIAQNLVYLKNIPEQMAQEGTQHVRPIRYHGQDLKQKYINQPLVQNYPQQVFLGRLFPQVNEVRQSGQLQTLYPQIPQTQYVPIEVVPPQEQQIRQLPLQPTHYGQFPVQTQDIPQSEIPSQHLSFIHIPVNKDVQMPQYIKAVVPITINAKTKLPSNQATEEPKDTARGVLYISPSQENFQSRFASTEIQGQVKEESPINDEEMRDPSADIAAIDFVRYIASKQDNDQYSDSVVIDAKTEEQIKEEEENETGDVVQSDEIEEPSIAQAQPAAIALAGPGGVATTAPRGTAISGENGFAVSSPRATSVAGPNTENSDKNKPTKKL